MAINSYDVNGEKLYKVYVNGYGPRARDFKLSFGSNGKVPSGRPGPESRHQA